MNKDELHSTDFLKFILIICVTGMTFINCSCTEKQATPQRIDEELMVDVPGNQLYARMRGNPDKPLIINLHGGPGGYSGIDIKLIGPSLEDKFLIAYLDQRGCGKSPECRDAARLTIGQYVEDLDLVIDALRTRYRKKQVALMGTSWGGMYGFLYLLKDGTKVSAYACIDGKVNSDYQNEFLLNFQQQKVDELLQGAISDERKSELEKIAAELIRIKHSDYTHFYKDVNWMLHEVSPKLGFNAYFVDTSKIISMNDVLQDTALLKLMNYSQEEYLAIGAKAEFVNQAFLDGDEYNDINIQNELSTIKIPTAVIQGEFDYVVGTGHAELIYESLTNLPDQNKELHILPNTGHCPAIESPGKLKAILVSFFEKHCNSHSSEL